MNQIEKLDKLLGIVGLLRANFSAIMKTIHDHRESYKTNLRYPPEELGILMGGAQEHFAELLKAGEFISTSKENTLETKTNAFDSYLEDWIVSQTKDRMENIQKFLTELSHHDIEGLNFDCKIWEEGEMLIGKALNLLN